MKYLVFGKHTMANLQRTFGKTQMHPGHGLTMRMEMNGLDQEDMSAISAKQNAVQQLS